MTAGPGGSAIAERGRAITLTDGPAASAAPIQLRQCLVDDGYLMMRGLLDPELVGRVRDDIIGVLFDCNILESSHAPAVWSGGPVPTEGEYMAYYERIVELDSFNALAESAQIAALMEVLWDGPVDIWRQRLVRIIPPDPAGVAPLGLGAHQDGSPQLGYLTDNFVTCWVPLTDIDASMGGLMLVPGSHRSGVREQTGSVASSLKAATAKPFDLDSAEEEWASTEYRAGDAVIFGSMTLHRGAANVSDRLRLSCDFRYQPAGASANWLANTPGPEVRRVAQEIDEVIASRALYVTTHASEELTDRIRRRMLAERSTSLGRAQQLAAELGHPQ